MSNTYEYPTLEKVKKSSKRQLAFWYRYLPNPGDNWKNHPHFEKMKSIEGEVIDLIILKLMPK